MRPTHARDLTSHLKETCRCDRGRQHQEGEADDRRACSHSEGSRCESSAKPFAVIGPFVRNAKRKAAHGNPPAQAGLRASLLVSSNVARSGTLRANRPQRARRSRPVDGADDYLTRPKLESSCPRRTCAFRTGVQRRNECGRLCHRVGAHSQGEDVIADRQQCPARDASFCVPRGEQCQQRERH